MAPTNDNDPRFASFDDDEDDRDPKERVAYYPHAQMWIDANGHPAEDEPYDFSAADRRSVAESIARIVEVYILASAETNFRGELTFKVHLPPPVKNPGFVAWERGLGTVVRIGDACE